MDFFDNGAVSGGMRYNKAQACIILQELYKKISDGNQRREELLAELQCVERELEDSRSQLRDMEAYSR